MRRFLHLSALAPIVAVVAAGCGGGAASGGADPATAVPASSSVYIEGVVRPEGGQKEDVMDAAAKILRTDDPEGKLRELFDKAVKEDGSADVDYDKDIEPWLGERAGIHLTNFSADEPDVLLVVATTDPEKARDSVFASMKRDGEKLRDGSHNGADYKVDAEGMATGLIGDFLAFGDEAEFKRGVDAEKGESLGDSKRYKDAIADLDDERLGTAYMDLKSIIDAAAKADPESAGEIEQARRLFEFDNLQPISAGLVANGDRIAVDSSTLANQGGELIQRLSLLQGEGPGELLGSLPGDSWLAYGVPKLGETAKTLYDQFAGALGGAAISGQIKEQTGLDLQQDVFSWIGDAALFVRGETTDTLEGALVIESTDPARARDAVTKLVGAARKQNPAFGPQPLKLDGADLAFQISGAGTPQPVIVAVGNGRAVVALGEKSAQDGLEAGDKLADADGYQAALETLEDKGTASLYLSMPAVVTLAAASNGSDPEFQKAKPYLDALSSVISGGEKDGDRVRSRLAVGLK